ncbi:hypothetical protein PsorP6_019608 [Peronosclerospora sorghi]|nr:hypothetical protein PsorP6_019608 [Peronosclerospora sorghi]
MIVVTSEQPNVLTYVRYPPGIGAADFFPKVVKRGVSLAGGLHKAIRTRYFRIRDMGLSTEVIEGALIECSHTVPHRNKAAKDLKKNFSDHSCASS